MNKGAKRYRQISIMESFAFNKKTKSEEDSNNQVQLKTNAIENKSSTEGPSNLQETKTKVQASDSFIIQYSGPKKKLDDAIRKSIPKSIFDELLDADDEDLEINNKSSQVTLKIPTKKPANDDDDEGSYRSSLDLFPEEPSVEDSPVPCSSENSEFIDSQKELFASDSPPEEYEEVESSSESEPDNITALNRSPQCDMPLPNLEIAANHSIMFSLYIRPGDAPRPFPKSYRDKWDSDHVRMPCSPLNRYPIENAMGEAVIGSRWDLICQSLRADIGSSEDLEKAIMKYNRQHLGKWNFLGLHSLINEHWTEEERDHFFEIMLPLMVEMALNLPNICTHPVPLLKKNKDHYLTISQKQIGCLLLNAFFCTFPRRNPKFRSRVQPEYAEYPDINFNRLFAGTRRGCPPRTAEKLKCLFNYFRRITSEEPTGTVTFHRQVISYRNLPNWYASTRGIRTAVIKSHGLIEEDGQGMLQVDFANRFVGGGVLGQGCVQEEIRFVCCPELIVSRLFVESLENNEALIVTGAEQYNNYSGYADTFKWEGDFIDNIPRDSWGRRCTKIVAIDAIHFKKTSDQFLFQNFKRELNKAYCGFYENTPPNHLPAVATGNWGCGAFGGSPNIKFLIQLMAASECGRSLVYYTFQNKKLKRELEEMYEFLTEKNLAIGDLWRILVGYCSNMTSHGSEKTSDLYSFIYSQFQSKRTSTSHQPENTNSNELTLSGKEAAELLFEDIIKSTSQDSEDIT